MIDTELINKPLLYESRLLLSQLTLCYHNLVVHKQRDQWTILRRRMKRLQKNRRRVLYPKLQSPKRSPHNQKHPSHQLPPRESSKSSKEWPSSKSKMSRLVLRSPRSSLVLNQPAILKILKPGEMLMSNLKPNTTWKPVVPM